MRESFQAKARESSILWEIQGQLLKIFSEEEDFIDMVGLSHSPIYLKICLYDDFLSKYTLLKQSTLAPSYFK